MCEDYSEKKESFSCYTGRTDALSNWKTMGEIVQFHYVNDLISE